MSRGWSTIARNGRQVALNFGEMSQTRRICTLNLAQLSHDAPPSVPISSTKTRLAEAFALLDNIDHQRANGQNSLLASVIEDRIIWRELLELELQHVDEQITAAAQGFL